MADGTLPKATVSGDSPLTLILNQNYQVDDSKCDFVWASGLRDDAETLNIRAMFNPDMFDQSQVEEFTELGFDIVVSLADEGNWGKEVRELRAITRSQATLQTKRNSKL